MGRLTLLCVITAAFTGLSSGVGVLPEDSVNASVGGSVTFTTSLTPAQTPLATTTWNFGDVQIVTSIGAASIFDPAYDGRSSLSVFTGSLDLRNVALSDNGTYSVRIQPTAGAAVINGLTTLNVYEPVSNVRLTATSTDLVEFNSSVSLSCSASGSSLSFLWFKDSVIVTASDRVHFTDGGATLTITPVWRSDQGIYTCQVSNPVSEGIISNKIQLFVSYGPEDVTLTPPPSDEYWEGSVVSLSCSSDSRPEAHFKYFINNEELSFTGAQINLVMEKSGNYSCQAFNSKTLRFTDSQPVPITVLMNIKYISVTPSPSPPIEGESLNLTCEASGSNPITEWKINGTELFSSDNIMFYDQKRVLSFKVLTTKDTGKYTCNVSNLVSSQTVDYIIDLNPPEPFIIPCPPGCIAGIVIGCIAVILIVAGGVFYALKKKKQKQKSSPRADGDGGDNSAYAQNQEVQYADVNFVKKDGGVVRLGVQNNAKTKNKKSTPAPRLPTYNDHMQRGKRPAPEPPTLYADVRPK